MSPQPPEAAFDVLRFWFLELGPQDWFSGDEALDRTIADRFTTLLENAAHGALDGWAESPRGLLALVIVLDQFSRKVFRGSARAYAQDEAAQRLAGKALEHGWDEQFGLDQRQFLYMPLMHAEDRDLQKLGVAKYTALAQEAANIVSFAHRHAEIVERFGRFPNRNAVLERQSSDEERAFIETQGNPFA